MIVFCTLRYHPGSTAQQSPSSSSAGNFSAPAAAAGAFPQAWPPASQPMFGQVSAVGFQVPAFGDCFVAPQETLGTGFNQGLMMLGMKKNIEVLSQQMHRISQPICIADNAIMCVKIYIYIFKYTTHSDKTLKSCRRMPPFHALFAIQQVPHSFRKRKAKRKR